VWVYEPLQFFLCLRFLMIFIEYSLGHVNNNKSV